MVYIFYLLHLASFFLLFSSSPLSSPTSRPPTNLCSYRRSTQESILAAQRQQRELRTRSEANAHALPLDDVVRVLADEWHAVLLALSRILAKLTKRIGRSYPADGGAFPRLFEYPPTPLLLFLSFSSSTCFLVFPSLNLPCSVLDRFFTLVREVFTSFPRVFLRTSPNTIKSPRNSITATPRSFPNTASSPRSARASSSPRVSYSPRVSHSPRVTEHRSPSPHHSSPPPSTFSFLSPFPSSANSTTTTPSTKSPVPKLALSAVYLLSFYFTSKLFLYFTLF